METQSSSYELPQGRHGSTGTYGEMSAEEPVVKVDGDVPVQIIPSITRCVIEMTEEEREARFRELGEERYQQYLENKRNGCYNRCHKTDWCKIEREKKEQEKKQEIATLTQRNQLLESHARKLEQDFTEYRAQTESRFDKLAVLISSLK